MQLQLETTGPGDSWGVLGLFHTESLGSGVPDYGSSRHTDSEQWCLPGAAWNCFRFPTYRMAPPTLRADIPPPLVTALHDKGLCKLNPL